MFLHSHVHQGKRKKCWMHGESAPSLPLLFTALFFLFAPSHMHSSPHGCHVTELKREAFAFLIPRISRLTCWFMWQCVCELYSWSQCVNIHTDLNMLTSTSCFFPHTVCTCKNKHSVDVRSLYFDTCCIKWRRDSLLPRSSDMELIVNNTEGIFLFCFVLFFKQEALRHDNNRKVNKSSYHSKQIHGYLDLMLTSIVNNNPKKKKTVYLQHEKTGFEETPIK